MSPNETLFLESTNKIYKDDISSSSFVNFQIWDFPGQVDFLDPTFDYEMIFRGTGALIFVIDAQVKNRNETLMVINLRNGNVVSQQHFWGVYTGFRYGKNMFLNTLTCLNPHFHFVEVKVHT